MKYSKIKYNRQNLELKHLACIHDVASMYPRSKASYDKTLIMAPVYVKAKKIRDEKSLIIEHNRQRFT